MSIARVKTWSSGEVLTASDLNSEFNNLINNPVDLWSPAGKAADFNGFEIVLDADADSSITADTDDRLDVRLGGFDAFLFDGTTATCVNGITFTATATGTSVTIGAHGETNVAITLKGKGTGKVVLGQATSTEVQLAADQPITDSSGNELLKFTKTATAVNEITVANNSTGANPYLAATGETNVGLELRPKGTGTILVTDGTDTTKKASFVISGVATGTARTITMPDANVDLQYSRAASDTVAGGMEVATQAEQETGTDTGRAVTPGRQQFHPSAAKVWCVAAGDGSAINTSFNMTSITDSGTGSIVFNIAADFSSANFASFVDVDFNANAVFVRNNGNAAGTVSGLYIDSAGTASDPDGWFMVAFGDQV